jgi:hypothetical protein
VTADARLAVERAFLAVMRARDPRRIWRVSGSPLAASAAPENLEPVGRRSTPPRASAPADRYPLDRRVEDRPSLGGRQVRPGLDEVDAA